MTSGNKTHDWVRMQGRFRKVQSCAACGMRFEKFPGSRGGFTRFVESNGSCSDSVTIEQPSCEGAPANWALGVHETAPLYGAATDKCRFCNKAIRQDGGCWENAEGGSEEGTVGCEKNPDEPLFEHEEEVAPHVPTTAVVSIHLWKGKVKRKDFEARLKARWPDLVRTPQGEGLSCYSSKADGSVMIFGVHLDRHVGSWQGGIGWIFSRAVGN